MARKEYLALAKSKKRTEKKIRATIRKQLGYVRRDLEYLGDYMEAGYALPSKYTDYYLTIQKLYEQQKHMYENKTHSVEDRIVSISQPYLPPIVRGKAKSPVEFGVKYDVSIDEKGHARLEKLSFDAYNENTILVHRIINNCHFHLSILPIAQDKKPQRSPLRLRFLSCTLESISCVNIAVI